MHNSFIVHFDADGMALVKITNVVTTLLISYLVGHLHNTTEFRKVWVKDFVDWMDKHSTYHPDQVVAHREGQIRDPNAAVQAVYEDELVAGERG